MNKINRSKSGKTEFSEEFAPKESTAPRIQRSEDLKVTAILDKTSLELFFDGGTTVMTEIFFPNKPFDDLWITSKNKESTKRDFLANAEFTAGRDEYYPIPQREIDFTGGVYVQNPGY